MRNPSPKTKKKAPMLSSHLTKQALLKSPETKQGGCEIMWDENEAAANVKKTSERSCRLTCRMFAAHHLLRCYCIDISLQTGGPYFVPSASLAEHILGNNT